MKLDPAKTKIENDKHKGVLGQIDYFWNDDDIKINNNELAYAIFDIVFNIIKNSPLKIVHKNLTILPTEDNSSEEGFTFCFCLDSSHFTGHCYFKSRLLAFDLFSCGSANVPKMINDLDDELKELIGNSLFKTQFNINNRFLTPFETPF